MQWRILTLFNLGLLIVLSLIGSYFLFRSDKQHDALTLYGNVDVRQVQIGFRVQGKVAFLCFEEGDCVKKGDLLAVLDKTPYNHKVKEAISQLEACKVDLANAEKIFERRAQLVGVGGVSREDFDNALTSKERLTAHVAEAEAALATAYDNLSYTEVHAPTDGVILTRIREPGTVVNIADPVYTLSVSEPIWIRAYVDEPDLGRVRYGMRARVYTDVANGPSYEGRVGFISPVAEFTPKTVQTTTLRTDLVYRLRIYVDDPSHTLLQGMPVTVKLITDSCNMEMP